MTSLRPLTFTLGSCSLLCFDCGDIYIFTNDLIFFTMTCLWTHTHCVKSWVLPTFCSTCPFLRPLRFSVDIWKHIRRTAFACAVLEEGFNTFLLKNIRLLCLIMLLLWHDEAFLGEPDLPRHARWAAFSSCACFLTRLKACFWHPATLPVIPPAACVPCRRKEAGDLAIATLPWATGSLPAAEGLLV